MLQHLDDAFAVVELVQAQVVDAACDDPASRILPHLVIPLIRDRLEAMALDPQVGSWECKGMSAPTTNLPVCAALRCACPPSCPAPCLTPPAG